MNTFTRTIGLALATVGSVAAVALSTAAAADAANKALMVNGLAAGNLTDVVMANVLGGMFGSYQRQNIPWPQQARPVTGAKSLTLTDSVTKGADNLDAAIVSSLAQLGPGEHITVVGLSAGALVVDEELRRLAANPSAPDKTKIDFVLVADSSRIGFNKNRYDAIIAYQYRPPVETKYNTQVVTGQYDGYADFPDRPANILAVANALAGAQLVHIPSMFTNLSTVPTSNVATRTNALGGVTTSYLVPTPTLPLVILNPKLKAQEAQLRKQIDAAYFRNDPKPATASAATPAASVAAPAAKAPAAPAALTGRAAGGTTRAAAAAGTRKGAAA